ncbi:sister-chromatid cohesion protein 3-like [Zingiber officinale]|uniref:sister-chromatid cohesion protein 3-like n=1 Tax=Zingiber officinale TaxID=94328 RepID=UPI001C4D773A|nr:sister-chromatid cohesion protein 3-like [Zingiber officinale]
MEHAAVVPEAPVRRKRGRPPKNASKAGVSKPSVSTVEKVDRSPTNEEQGSGDGSYDAFDDHAPKAKRKAAIRAAGWKEDQSLIDVIKHNGRVINHAVKKWIERYELDPKPATIEILMLLFEACGAKYKLEVASFEETNVDDVVVSLVELAKKGEIEDNFNSKQKELKNFKENLASFWDNLVIECQNGPLFDKFLFEKCMDYAIALSCTPPRVYRHVASLVGLQLVTSLINVAKMLSGQRETTQRQLNTEKKKNNDGPRLESLNKRLSQTHEKITTMEEMMRKLFKGLFMHRYRDVDPEIRMSCISSLGNWILLYPSLFLQDLYLKYLGWTLNDKSPGVRKASIIALQNLYEVDDNVPSLGLFTERFCSRMIELADDIDIAVAVSAIGLLKQLLRHQLLTDDELGPLYDLLIDEPPLIRRAIGELVYDHLIAQKIKSSHSGRKDGEEESSEVHLGRMLQILREFPDDPMLSTYVIDDVWDNMKAMKDWKCIISMLLDENPHIELTDVDATNLVRLLYASARKAVGDKIVPAADGRKQYYTKVQKETFENNRRKITTAMMKKYPQLLHKYIADKAKISSLVEIMGLLKLELFSLQRQDQNFKAILELIVDAFFKHGEKDTLRSCIRVITFCSTDSPADLQDYAQNKLKDLENDLIIKLKAAIKEVEMGGDEYSLLVNLKRLNEFQLTKFVPVDSLYGDMSSILKLLRDIDNEVKCFLLLNMYLHVAWSLTFIDVESPESSINELLSKRATLFEQLECFINELPNAPQEGRIGNLLSYRVCVILADLWCLFENSRFSSTKLHRLGYHPDISSVEKFWKLSQQLLSISDETEEEDSNEEYIEDTNRDVVMIAAAKLVIHRVTKDYLAAEIISHFVMHGASITNIIKNFITSLRKTAKDEMPSIFFEALKKTYQRQALGNESLASNTYSDCKDLSSRLSATFGGAARNKHKWEILKIIKDGISYAFSDAPKHLSFLEVAVLPFVTKLPISDLLEILKDVQKRSDKVNINEDPSGWRPYSVFVEYLQEKCAKNDLQDEKEGNLPKRRGRPRKAMNVEGKRLFDGHESSEEDSISGSEQDDQDEEEDEEAQQPLIHTFRASASKLRSMRVAQPDSSARQAGSGRTTGTDH